MKLPAIIMTVILTVAGTTLLIAAGGPQDDAAARAVQQEESASKVMELKKERLATVREMLDATRALYRSGRVNYDRFYDTQQLLLKAELDLAKNDDDRIKLYEKFVDVTKENEGVADSNRQSGRGTIADVLRAKATRLEAEIVLEQARAKVVK